MKRTVYPGVVFSLIFLFNGFLLTGSGEAEVLPPDILPVIVLKGTDYAMGCQYGRQAAGYIRINIRAAWADALLKYDKTQVIRMLKANQYYIDKHTPECRLIMEGIRDGVNVSGEPVTYTDILLLNCTLPKPEAANYPAGAAEVSFPPEKKCSVSSAWGSATTSGQLVGMDTLDAGEAQYGVVIVAYPDRGNAYICGAQAGEIGDHFLMNNRGLFLGNSGGGGSVRNIDENFGVSWSCSLSHLVRFAENAEAGKKMLETWQINIPENFHLVDVAGNAFVVEKTAAVQCVRSPGEFGERDFLYSTNNYLCRGMAVTKKGGFIKKHGGYGDYSAPRNLMLWDMLNNYHGSVDAEFMKMMLRFPGADHPAEPEDGWDAKICRPSNSWVSVLLPDNGDRGMAHICTGPAGRVIHSSMSSSGDPMESTYLSVNGTHTFFSLRLAPTPAEMVRESRKTAQKTIARAYQKLMYLNYGDTGFVALQKIYFLATSEYFLGNQQLNNSVPAKGNEAVVTLGRAATFYSRAMAHADQVYEALVSPPTRPADLGLKPFGGNWAQWETRIQ